MKWKLKTLGTSLIIGIFSRSFQLQCAEPLTLPLEIFQSDVAPVTRTLSLSDTEIRQAQWIRLEFHSLNDPEEIRIGINASKPLPIHNRAVEVEQPMKFWGGIGSSYPLIHLRIPSSQFDFQSGENRIHFHYTYRMGYPSNGIRLLAFEFLKSDGTPIPLAQTPKWDDDSSRTLPLVADPERIREGRRLWYEASLQDFSLDGKRHTLRARCSDCHVSDGRDLKYFDYSNHSIVARSLFHGLSQSEGESIALYIRSLPGPNPGRPWNPPYQPGPGLDQAPVSHWAAGAGREWILKDDAETWNYLFPNSISDSTPSTPSSPHSYPVQFSATTNVREIPIALAFPDWNSWLPSIHPLDTFGSDFETSKLFHAAQSLPTQVQSKKANPGEALKALERGLRAINAYHFEFRKKIYPKYQPQSDPKHWGYVHWSVQKWKLIQFWDLMTQTPLEEEIRQYYGPQAEIRGWPNEGIPFRVGPHIGNVPRETFDLGDKDWRYQTMTWYQLQLVLSPGHKTSHGNSPIDWGYALGFSTSLTRYDATQEMSSQAITYLNYIKQAENYSNGRSPLEFNHGWQPSGTNPGRFLAHMCRNGGQKTIDLRTKTLVENYAREWLKTARTFPPEAYDHHYGTPKMTFVNKRGNPMDVRILYPIQFFIRRGQELGLDLILLKEYSEFASTLFPEADWNSLFPNSDTPSKPAKPSRRKKS